MKSGKTLFADLVDMENSQKVFEEVKTIVLMIDPEFDLDPLNEVFADIRKLFGGEYPGYLKCKAPYHDFKHTTDVLLAMARMMHGYGLHKEPLIHDYVNLGLIAALLHDTGYIQEDGDSVGSGARYTLIHVERSIQFMKEYFKHRGFSGQDFENGRTLLLCTDLNTEIDGVAFNGPGMELLGKMLGTADMLGQMADRTYLEKLLLLYYEFKEAEVGDYANEFDLLQKTRGFYDYIEARLTDSFSDVRKFLVHHFRVRWNIEKNLYTEAIEKNMKYLNHVIEHYESQHRLPLRRGGIVERLNKEGL